MKKTQQIQVLWIDVSLVKIKSEDYISLTDILKAKEGDFFISDWLRNRNTVEYLSIREELHNPNFNCGESAIIKSQIWLNSYRLSVKDWSEKTNAIWLIAHSGRYWGTYAHKDIAFEFWMRISPKFKLYLIKEFQRLKDQELKSMDRDVKRFLTKMNYRIHTDAIKENLIPQELSPEQINNIYADEADILNIALFGQTAKQRRDNNISKKGNIRDYATIEQLIILANMESMNAQYISLGVKQSKRLGLLNKMAIIQMKSLLKNDATKKLSYQKTSNTFDFFLDEPDLYEDYR